VALTVSSVASYYMIDPRPVVKPPTTDDAVTRQARHHCDVRILPPCLSHHLYSHSRRNLLPRFCVSAVLFTVISPVCRFVVLLRNCSYLQIFGTFLVSQKLARRL